MDKKYSILKHKPLMAQASLKTLPITQGMRPPDMTQFNIGQMTGASNYANAMNQQKGMLNQSSGMGMGIASAGIAVADMAQKAIFSNIENKNRKFDGFGNEIVDDKFGTETAKAATSGALNGAKAGMSVAPFLGPFAPLATAVGALVGGIFGGVTGNKKAKAAREVYTNTLAGNKRSKGVSDDLANSQAMMQGYQLPSLQQPQMSKNGAKLDKYNLGGFKFNSTKSGSLMLRSGGKLETPGMVNVVVKGKLHKENNNLGNKDKGIPVINTAGNKEYEVEEGEVVFRKEFTDKVEEYAKAYNDTKNEDIFEALGQLIAAELLHNTQDNYGKFDVELSDEGQKKYEDLVEKVIPVEEIVNVEKPLREKPEFNIKFVSDKALLDYDDPVEKRLLLKSIKNRYNELKAIFNNL